MQNDATSCAQQKFPMYLKAEELIVLNLSPSQHFFSLLKIQMLFQPMWFVEIAMEKTNLF
jgi:hypothetical protein